MWQLAAGRVTSTRPQSPYIFAAVLAFSCSSPPAVARRGGGGERGFNPFNLMSLIRAVLHDHDLLLPEGGKLCNEGI